MKNDRPLMTKLEELAVANVLQFDSREWSTHDGARRSAGSRSSRRIDLAAHLRRDESAAIARGGDWDPEPAAVLRSPAQSRICGDVYLAGVG